jgi:hypothetical protein
MKNILILALLFVTNLVFAQSSCKADYTGKVYCAQPGGSAVETINGIVCAPGICVVNSLGFLKCSNVVAGGATVNDLGKTFCLGGCINPSKDYCVELKKGD